MGVTRAVAVATGPADTEVLAVAADEITVRASLEVGLHDRG
jgi:hypothetical protein